MAPVGGLFDDLPDGGAGNYDGGAGNYDGGAGNYDGDRLVRRCWVTAAVFSSMKLKN